MRHRGQSANLGPNKGVVKSDAIGDAYEKGRKRLWLRLQDEEQDSGSVPAPHSQSLAVANS